MKEIKEYIEARGGKGNLSDEEKRTLAEVYKSKNSVFGPKRNHWIAETRRIAVLLQKGAKVMEKEIKAAEKEKKQGRRNIISTVLPPLKEANKWLEMLIGGIEATARWD